MKPKKAVITAAGLGTRLLPMSKELPKEMLPIFSKGKNFIVLKPLLQALFEQLYDFGFTDFCFVVGRGKRAIEDHFTPDYDFLSYLKRSNKFELAYEMRSFYKKVEKSRIVWINQPQPKGFGDAVSMAKGFIGDDDFLVAAGDTYVISKGNDFLRRLIKVYETKGCCASLLVLEVEDPRQYGVVEVLEEDRILKVISATEKPKKPRSKLAIVPIYVFKSEILDIISSIRPKVGGEVQLTDAIQKLVVRGYDVYAVKLRSDELMLDIGTPQTYWDAIKSSYVSCRENKKPM